MRMVFLLAAFVASLSRPAAAADLLPLHAAQDGDFGHYTLAVTWQPGFCGTGSGCLADQPHAKLIGLHGLWASLPGVLVARGVPEPQWWRDGCDELHHGSAAPVLPSALRQQLAAVVPHLRHDLLVHEYEKHVQCFGFDPATFFGDALLLRDDVAASGFGAFLRAKRGQEVSHDDATRAFERAFGTALAHAAALECEEDRTGRTVLTQVWITIRTASVAQFPAASSLMDSPIDQDHCPARFTIPDWDAP